ncbi:C45 family autoproteolytic acyltransferase/hydolase [Desulfobacca acetoxidans]
MLCNLFRHLGWSLIISLLSSLSVIFFMLGAPLQAADHEKYRLFYIHDLPVLMLWGTPEESGRVQGRLFQAQIQKLVQQVLKRQGGSSGSKTTEAETLRYLKSGLARLPASLKDELQGIAHGAGVPLEDIYLLNFHAETVLFPHCSTIGVRGSRASGSNMLIGHNFDAPEFSRASVVLLAYGQPGAIPFVAVTVPGIPFPTFGCNAQGVTATLNTAFTTESLPEDAQFVLPLLRQALAQADNATQAERIITRSPRFHSWNVILGDAKTNRLVCLELGLRHWSMRAARYGLLISTNHWESSQLQPLAQPPTKGSITRYSRLLHLASEKERLGVADLEDILLDPQVWDDTVYSAVLNPEALRLSLCPGQTRTYTPVDIGKILRSFPRID